jgi:hypothetical protein
MIIMIAIYPHSCLDSFPNHSVMIFDTSMLLRFVRESMLQWVDKALRSLTGKVACS